MAFGINKKLQVGRETTYGTIGTATNNLNYLSESINLNVEKTVEETLLASKSVSGFDIVGYTVDGDISLNLKPEDAGLVLAWALGNEAVPTLKAATTGVYEHVLTAPLPTGLLPACTVTVDRGAAVKGYTGCQVDKITIGAKAKETLKATISVKGRGEETNTINATPTNPSLSAFRFVGGTVEFNDSSYGTIDSVDWSYSNGLEDGFYTLGSGLYPERHQHGLKTSEISISALYDATTEAIRETNYKTGTYVKVEFVFESPAEVESGEPYMIKVEMPMVQITEATANIGGKERIMISLKGTATENTGVEPTTVTVTNGTSTRYFS